MSGLALVTDSVRSNETPDCAALYFIGTEDRSKPQIVHKLLFQNSPNDFGELQVEQYAIEKGTIKVSKTLTPQDISSATAQTGTTSLENEPLRSQALDASYVEMRDTVLHGNGGSLETTNDQIEARGGEGTKDATSEALTAQDTQGFYVEMKDVVLYDADGNLETTNDQITANGGISFNPTFNFDMTVDNFQLKQLTFTTTITETVAP